MTCFPLHYRLLYVKFGPNGGMTAVVPDESISFFDEIRPKGVIAPVLRFRASSINEKLKQYAQKQVSDTKQAASVLLMKML